MHVEDHAQVESMPEESIQRKTKLISEGMKRFTYVNAYGRVSRVILRSEK